MTAYLYPTYPCGDNNRNWLEAEIRDAWKDSCLPYFCFPFSWNGPSELNGANTPYDQPFWLYFYYSESATDANCPEKNDLARLIEYRVRVVQYTDENTNPNPFDTGDTLVIPISEPEDVKIWFKCDRFEEVRVASNINEPNRGNHQRCRRLGLDDFEYVGENYQNAIGLGLQRICPWRRVSPLVVVQATVHNIED